jgi:hypothetical protein
MPQKVLKFTGINRKVNEFESSGACEELINLRPGVRGGCSVVKPKKIVESNVQYESFYAHEFGDIYNRIVVYNDGSIVWTNTDKDAPVVISDEIKTNDISLSSAGNVLVAYSEKENKQLVFKFEEGEYKPYRVSVKPIIKTGITLDYKKDSPYANSAIADNKTVFACNETLQKVASGFYKKYPNGICGAAIIGCAYELEDGFEFWSTSFIVANVARENGYVTPTIGDDLSITVTGASKAILNLEFADTDAIGIKRLNIYATRPIFPYNAVEVKTTPDRPSDIHFEGVSLDEYNLSSELMYYQGSVEVNKKTASFVLNFGKEQAGDSVMEVNPGCIERIGNNVSYNNRFHFYRSNIYHVLQTPTVSRIIDERSSGPMWISYVNFDGKWRLTGAVHKFSDSLPNDFAYPMAGVSKLAFVKGNSSESSFNVPYEEMFYVEMKDSQSYNYSYAFDITPKVVSAKEFQKEISETGQLWGDPVSNKIFWKKELNAINVSAHFNPYVFPVEYSYSIGGEILDIATSYLPISSTQVGQFPLTIFSSNGIYALEQGNGNVLYSNITPLQPLVIEGKAIATPFGTFFISSKSLFVLSGREVINISYILNGERELTLRDVEAYKRLCFDKTGSFFDFSRILSGEDFEDFISDAIFTYDQLQNELYISSRNENIAYSYVLNLDTKAYHKIAKRYLEAKNGARYVIEAVGVDKNLVDLHIEEKAEQAILLQSRPFGLEVLYTHIQRLILPADANLTCNQNLCISVFGSDNLHDWKCIISSQKHNAILRHIRTNKAAKSYKDYVILITGTVDTNTDISDLIADYTVVNRRLG